MNAAFVVFAKECRESVRDRRVLLNALVLGPLFTPLLFLLLMHLIVGREIEKAERPLPVTVIGAEHAPNFVEALRQLGLQQRAPIDDPELAVREQREDLVLRIAPRFADDWRAGRPAQIEVIYDSSRQEVRGELERLHAMIESVAQRDGALRLLARGIAPSVAAPVVIAGRDQATPEARGAMLLGMLPYFLILTALIGGMWLAIDSTAGERERQSLEPLLINPAPRHQFLAGKLLATAAFSMASLILGLLAFLVVGYLLPTGDAAPALSIGAPFVLTVLPMMVPLVLFIAAAQVWIASFARSFREAQTYLGLAQLVPLIPSVMMMAVPLRAQLWMAVIPIFGQQVAILRLLRGEYVRPESMLLGAAVTLLATAGVFWLTLRLYQSERVAISA